MTVTGITVLAGEEVKFDLKADLEEWNTLVFSNMKFTPDRTATDAPVLGFKINSNGDIHLINSSPFDINYTGFGYTPLLSLPDSAERYDLLDTLPPGSGFGTVPADSQILVLQLPGMSPGDLLMLNVDEEWTDTGIANSQNTSRQLMFHEHQDNDIPTLTEWGMIIFCALLFAWMAWVVVRRRKQVVQS